MARDPDDLLTSSQHAKLEDNIRQALIVQRQSSSVGHVQGALGICYGKSPGFVDRGLYCQYMGQRFWQFLSGDSDLYLDLIEPIGYEAKRHNESFEERRAAIQNALTFEFCGRFCGPDYAIDWQKLIVFNSGNAGRD